MCKHRRNGSRLAEAMSVHAALGPSQISHRFPHLTREQLHQHEVQHSVQEVGTASWVAE